MQVHNLTKSNSSQDSKRVGRGGKRGKTSGKGMKGQNARQGNSKRPEMRDLIKKIPKLRGQGIHGNRARAIMKDKVAINVAMLQTAFPQGGIVSPKTLMRMGLVSHVQGAMPGVKILGSGDISVSVTVVGCQLSTRAEEKIKQAGGSVK